MNPAIVYTTIWGLHQLKRALCVAVITVLKAKVQEVEPTRPQYSLTAYLQHTSADNPVETNRHADMQCPHSAPLSLLWSFFSPPNEYRLRLCLHLELCLSAARGINGVCSTCWWHFINLHWSLFNFNAFPKFSRLPSHSVTSSKLIRLLLIAHERMQVNATCWSRWPKSTFRLWSAPPEALQCPISLLPSLVLHRAALCLWGSLECKCRTLKKKNPPGSLWPVHYQQLPDSLKQLPHFGSW